MRFMNSRVLPLDGTMTGDRLTEHMEAVVGELETDLRRQAARLEEPVASWAVNIEYRSERLPDGDPILVPAEFAEQVHITVLLVTARLD